MNERIRKEHIKKLAESRPDREAYKRFKSPPYQVGRLIRAQGDQMTVAEYVAQKYDIKTGGNASGQEEAETVPGIAARAETE